MCLTVFTDVALIDYLRENVRGDQIFFVASQDEASYSYVYIHELYHAGSYSTDFYLPLRAGKWSFTVKLFARQNLH